MKGIYLYGNEKLDEAFKIRRKVFHEEQKIDPIHEFDAYDKEAIHVLVYDQEEPVATGRLVYNGQVYKIGRIAVLKESRGKSIGEFVVRMLLDKAFLMGADEVIVHAQVQVVPFYEKLGFEAYESDFIEAGILHRAMRIKKNQMKCKGCQ